MYPRLKFVSAAFVQSGPVAAARSSAFGTMSVNTDAPLFTRRLRNSKAALLSSTRRHVALRSALSVSNRPASSDRRAPAIVDVVVEARWS